MNRILLFLTTHLWFAYSYAQIRVNLPNIASGTLVLYSYYPAKMPATVGEIVNGTCTLTMDYKNLKDGMYSLYYTNNNSIQGAPFIDLWITKDESSFDVFWAPGWPFLDFYGSPINKEYHKRKKEISDLQTELEKYLAAKQNFLTAPEALVKQWTHNLDSFEQRLHNISNQLELNKTLYMRPLLFSVQKTHAFEKPDFSKTLIARDYHTSIVSQYIEYLSQPFIKEGTLDSEKKFLSLIVDKLANNSEGINYLLSWADVYYDLNSKHDLYLFFFEQLAKSSAASAEQKKLWNEIVQNGQHLKIGQVFPKYLLPENASRTKEEKLCLILYSESCGSCAEALEKFNSSKNLGKRIAIRVKLAEESASFVQADKYPNIEFYYPSDIEKYQDYKPRGTPTVIYLEKKSKEWLISGLN